MSGKSQRLVFVSLGIASLSLAISGLCVVFLFTKDNYWKSELSSRLVDLEEEHDLLLDQDSPLAAGQAGRPRLCDLRPEPGPCSSQVMRWYFLEKEGDCIEFPWGGCQGNNNNFLSLEQCRSTCGVPLLKARPLHLVGHTSEASPPRPLLPASPTQPFDISDCLHPPDSGPCGNRITRYYFADGQCQRFEYGGCAGNKNNFFTEGECTRRCTGPGARLADTEGAPRGARDERTGGPAICLLPEDIGVCKARIPRFRWDSRLHKCVSFFWGGCGGNSNNFISVEKCKNRCQ